jgi:hypothetical protein
MNDGLVVLVAWVMFAVEVSLLAFVVLHRGSKQ